MLSDRFIIRSGNYRSFKKMIMQPGFYLYLTSFDSKWYTVRFDNPKLGEKMHRNCCCGVYDSVEGK